MVSLQQEVRSYLAKEDIEHIDHTTSFEAFDFSILRDGATVFELEVKEKRKPYRASNWPTSTPEPDLFILDDLTVRKCLLFAPRCGILVRDSGQNRYGFFSVVDLALMPKQRVNRPIDRGVKGFKGKWMVDLNNSALAGNMEDAFDHVRNYLVEMETILLKSLPCYGDYIGEAIETAGKTRRPHHWVVDVRETK